MKHLTKKEQTFIKETLQAIVSGGARIGCKHYTVSLGITEMHKLIAKMEGSVTSPLHKIEDVDLGAIQTIINNLAEMSANAHVYAHKRTLNSVITWMKKHF